MIGTKGVPSQLVAFDGSSLWDSGTAETKHPFTTLKKWRIDNAANLIRLSIIPLLQWLQPPITHNLDTELRMNTNQMQNAVTQPSMPSQPMQQQSSPKIFGSAVKLGWGQSPTLSGNTVMLLDAENSVFYLKSADARSGMPLPLRIFDYKERTTTAHRLLVAL